jgi:hypothetical protein
MHARPVGQRQRGLRRGAVERHAEQRRQHLRPAEHLRIGGELLGGCHKGLAGLLHPDAPPDNLDLINLRVIQVALGRSPAERGVVQGIQGGGIIADPCQRPATLAILANRRTENLIHQRAAFGHRRKRVEQLQQPALVDRAAQRIRRRLAYRRLGGQTAGVRRATQQRLVIVEQRDGWMNGSSKRHSTIIPCQDTTGRSPVHAESPDA